MEIVTLVQISLNRIGTASGVGSGFMPTKSRMVYAETKDAEIQTLRDVVCGFHADSDTHSTRIRTVIPR